MSELLKKQNYGVEVEFTGISRKMAADAVAEISFQTRSHLLPDKNNSGFTGKKMEGNARQLNQSNS